MLKIGHRGAAGHAPENTLASIRLALDMGVDGIEFDVHTCKTGEAVVIHDATVTRTTGARGRVADMTLAELKTLDAGNGERIPTLEDVIQCVDRRALLLIELKDHASVAPVGALVTRYANAGWGYDKLVVIGFNHCWLKEVKQRDTNIVTGASLGHVPIDGAACGEHLGAWSVNPHVDYTDAALVADAHTRGLKVLVWTANTPEQIARARALGVDGIVSDYPDRLF